MPLWIGLGNVEKPHKKSPETLQFKRPHRGEVFEN